VKWFIVILLGFGIWGLGFVAPRAKAACFPPGPDGQCSTGLTACSNDTTCCTFSEECTNRTSSCSSDKPWERIPTCDVCGNVLFCSGNNYRLCSTDSTFPAPQTGLNRSDYVANSPPSVTFNGVNYSVPGGGLYYCDSNVFGCRNPACSNSSGGAGESRLWFPHLRNISALSTLLQSIFNPSPSTFIKNAIPSKSEQTAGLDNPAAVTTRIDYHQGFDDRTITVGDDKNNSSLIQGREAPAPLYNFGGSEPYKQSGLCTITDAKSNPGDDLLGPKITTRLTYTQEYEYEVAPSADCAADGQSTDKEANCCSFKYGGVKAERIPKDDNPASRDRYICGTLPGKDFPTQGRAVVYTKTPLVEYIYNTLVTGPQSVLNRLFPQGQQYNEIPAQANFSASAVGLNQEGLPVNMKAGNGSTPPTLNFPHLGSLYEYFLVGLQKALRPSGFSVPSGNQNVCTPTLPSLPSVDPQCQTCSISFPSPSMKNIFESAASFYKVPVSVLAGIFYNEGGLNPSWNWDDSKVVAASGPNCQVANCDSGNTSSSGAKGPWQFLPSTWSSFSNAAAEAGVSDGRTPNICNLLDSTFAAAKKISQERGGKDRYDPPQCVGYLLNTNKGPSQSCVWNRSDTVTAARQYLGYCEDPQNPDPRYPPRSSCIADPSTCYQRSVLNIATCLVSP